jgi:Tol biopolymer transport system component/DNA-binding winged helix-turn-helix (wHTH) protein
VRFGAFEANLCSGELRKHGIRLKLHEQPFQVLAMLVARPGELLTREELQQKLWPSGTFVDFENGLNSAVNRLRDALGDSADQPKFIETVPRRGYRWIASVSRYQAALPNPELSTAPQDGPVAPGLSPTRQYWNGKLLFGAGVLATVALMTTIAWRSGHGSPPEPLSADPKPKPVPIVTYGGGGQWLPAFSPDGTRVAYSWNAGGEWYLEVKVLGTDTRLRLTKQPAQFPPGPAWSPDGREIAFVRAGALDDRGIFITSALGGPERKLRSLAPWRVPQRVVSWSPDGHWIAFADEAGTTSSPKPREHGPNALYLISPETLETRQLTTPAPEEFGDTAPTFSPDGRTIAFVHTTAESRDVISMIPLQGGTPQPLVTDGIWTNGLTWTADGASIVFDRSFVGGFSLWRVPVKGGEPHRLDLPADRANMLEPTLLRGRLAYEAHEAAETVGRVSLNKSFSQLPQTPVASTRFDHAGRYSPNGAKIAFLTDRSGTDELWIADADGTNAYQLTHFGVRLADLVWAPDGKSLAASAVAGKVYLVPLEAGSPRLIFNGPPFIDEVNSNLAFSRDGRFVYVMTQPGTGNKCGLLKVPISGEAPAMLLDGLFTNAAESTDGHTLFYSRPESPAALGRPGIWKRAVEGGPEQFVTAYSDMWDLGPDGLYLVNRKAATLEKYNSAGKRLQAVAKLGQFDLRPPMSISPDGRWAIFGYQHHLSIEIDMVEGFK